MSANFVNYTRLKGEIDGNFYCSAHCYDNGYCLDKTCIVNENKCEQKSKSCKSKHRKWPTPKQYREEYGEQVPDDMPVFILLEGLEDWKVVYYREIKHGECFYLGRAEIVIALVVSCTPWGKPSEDWRLE